MNGIIINMIHSCDSIQFVMSRLDDDMTTTIKGVFKLMMQLVVIIIVDNHCYVMRQISNDVDVSMYHLLPVLLADVGLLMGIIFLHDANFDSKAPTFLNKSLTIFNAEILDEADNNVAVAGDNGDDIVARRFDDVSCSGVVVDEIFLLDLFGFFTFCCIINSKRRSRASSLSLCITTCNCSFSPISLSNNSFRSICSFNFASKSDNVASR
ncbi:hypothetical protein DERP_012882 [Dermatophagoides pteronyssinus]|uniref:Uncharacterized protein n=1 Tax=Dermatophagoides pteronyssinus TaxID=6956 RepID=A0ABQ8J1N9_DERPT|nr:hypothetical protein DERP_012882 [Dermatophagoides pteronyssinus]